MGDPDLHGLASRVDGLRALVDEREERSRERHASLKESIAQALTSSDKAIAAAAQAMDARVALLNELRQVVEAQGRNFATKLEVAYLRESIGKLEVESGKRAGRDTGSGHSWNAVAGIIAAAVGIVAIVAFVRTL